MAEHDERRQVALDATATPESPALDATVASAQPPVGPARELPEIPDARYTLGLEIGRGGIGRVVRARDEVLERPVALKELFASDDASRRRFLREALITARLQHPSIVPVYDAGRHADRSPFYAMKLVAGEPLERAIAAATTLEARLALVPTVLAVADAIAYAHHERIIHRDLKPGNVLVGKFGETVVIDWGLAKDLSIEDVEALPAGPYRAASTAHTVAGAVMGTPGYMAPEQAAGEDSDERADVYALGAILYHVIGGAVPHQGTTIEEVIAKVIRGDIQPLLEREPGTPRDLAAIVDKAMAVDKARRYRDAGALADDLRKFQTGQLVGAHRYTTGQRLRRWLRRHRAIAAVVAVAVIVVAVVAALSISRVVDERELATVQRDAAVAKSNQAIIYQARSLRAEPARLLTLLGTLDPAGPGWDAARMLAGEALSQPRLIAQTRGPAAATTPFSARPELALAPDGSRAIAFDGEGVWLMDLVGMKTRSIRYGNDPYELRRLAACDDLRHAYVLSGGFVDARIHQVDAVAGTTTAMAGDGPELIAAAQRCNADLALIADGAGLRWRDPATGVTKRLSTTPMDAAWLAPDRRHVLALTRKGSVVRLDLAGNQLGELIAKELDPATELVPQLDNLTRRPIAKAALSADGAVAITWSHQVYTYWNFTHGSTLLLHPKDAVEDFVVAPDGGFAYLSTTGGGLEIGSRPDPIAFASATVPRGYLAISPDGAWLAGAHAGKVTLLDRALDMQQPLAGHVGVENIAFTRDGRLFTLGADAARLWDLGAPGHSHGRIGVFSAAFSPDGRWLALDDNTQVVRWDVERRAVDAMVARERSTSGESSVAIANTGEVVFTVKDAAFRWRRGGAAERLGEHPDAVSISGGLLPDGTPITVSHDRVVVWRAAGRQEIVLPARQAARRPGLHTFELDDRGSRALVVCRPVGETQRTCLVELGTGKVTLLDESTGLAALSPDGKVAITGLDGDAYAVWDLDRVRRIRWSASVGAATELGVARDGTRAMVGGLGGVDVIDLATFVIVPVVATERATGERVQFSPDGNTVVGHDLVLRDTRSGELWRVPRGERLPVTWHLGDRRLVMVTQFGIRVVEDELPRDPVAFKARLLALPYQLDDHGALIVKPRATGSR